ncbi:CRTAC1 family protein [Streptosporangium fragile]|uniref:CRTAC1 family protein n=1 Tax=Streptosporangium fragile TaxID=46186 RepID=A0ABN3W3P3_9ACTN
MLTDAPDIPPAEASAEFSFHAEPLGPPGRPGDRTLRRVAPGYERVRAWVSATGAAVALFDVDNAVVSDDVCLVDPRHDTVTVRPAPGTSGRYRPFTLVPPDRRPYEAPTGCLPADLDQDGWQDLVVYYWGRSPSLFLRVPGAPPSGAAFRHRGLTAEPEIWNTSAATVGDFDGDGRLDLVFGNYFPDGARVLDGTGDHGDIVTPDSLSAAGNGGTDRLYRATGPAAFAEVKGVFDDVGGGRGWTLALGAQDLDRDGRPELYVANDFGPDRLLVNESAPGRVRFTEARGVRHPATPRSRIIGRDSAKGAGVGFTDLDADGGPDILVSNAAEDRVLPGGTFAFLSRPGGLHEGHAPYDDRAGALGLRRAGWAWDVKAADFDNDGDDEVLHAAGFVRGEVDRWAQFQEAMAANDLAASHPSLWPGIGAGDDLSGRTPNTFFTRGPDGRYTDVARRAGVAGGAVSRALAVGDVDDDGRLDFAVANQWAASALYRNHGPTASFVGLRLRLPAGHCPATGDPAAGGSSPDAPATGGPAPGAPAADGSVPGGPAAGPRSRATRPAIGAVATVRLPDGSTRSRQLYPAGGHNGVSAPELLFGLGDEMPDAPLPVEISWRDACGGARSASVSLEPGWHRILLADGRASEVRHP